MYLKVEHQAHWLLLCSAGVHVCVTVVNFTASDAQKVRHEKMCTSEEILLGKTNALQLNQTTV